MLVLYILGTILTFVGLQKHNEYSTLVNFAISLAWPLISILAAIAFVLE